MNEAQTRLDKIDPKLRDAGWGIVPGSNILVEYTAEPSLSCMIYDAKLRRKNRLQFFRPKFNIVFDFQDLTLWRLLNFHFADKKFGRLNVSHYLCIVKVDL